MSVSRIHINMQKRHLTILVPVKKNKKLMTWVLLTTIPWSIVLWLIIDKMYQLDSLFWWKAFTLLAIMIWSIIGLAGYTILSFMFFGREKILVSPKQILIEKPLVFYNRRNYYLIKDISNLRMGRELYKVRHEGEWLEKQRNILQMDYPQKQVSFARGVSKEEAERILLKIAESGMVPVEAFAKIHQI